MAKRKLSVAIIGAGMGGLTAAATLRRVGIEVRIYEQASKFARIGAGIQQSSNAIPCRAGVKGGSYCLAMPATR